MPSPANGHQPLLALSLDVEDYFHVEAFADRIRPEDWPQFPSRVQDNTLRLLELFARYQTKATFFILGCVAEQYPGLVREVVDAGHEIGCHSFSHRALWRLNPEQFRADTRRAIATLEQAAGTRVLGYRAPTFSLVAKTRWAVEILAEEGLFYDSSVFPIQHDLYGVPEAPRFPFEWRMREGLQLYEFPMTTARVFGRNLPAAGGGYLRILPFWYSRWALGRVVNGERRPAVIYFHPWEIDPQQPRIAAGWRSRLRHYTHLKEMQSRIVALLSRWRFVPIREVLQVEVEKGALPVWQLVAATAR